MDTRTIDIPVIPSTRRYWLIRTERGKFYRDFKENGYVALGWDHFTNHLIYSKAGSFLVRIDFFEYAG